MCPRCACFGVQRSEDAQHISHVLGIPWGGLPPADGASHFLDRVGVEQVAQGSRTEQLPEQVGIEGDDDIALGGADTASGGADVWQTRIESLDFVTLDGTPDLVARLSLVPRDPAQLSKFTLRWRAVIGTVPDHFVLLMLRRDPVSKLGNEPDVIGTLRASRNALEINRRAARSWMPFANAVSLGAGHILGGIDHLAFLLALLLPLPLGPLRNRLSPRCRVNASMSSNSGWPGQAKPRLDRWIRAELIK